MTTNTDTAAARIVAADTALRAAQAAFEQAVRDEIAADRITPSAVARALGVRNRQRIYAIIGRGSHGAEPTAPQLPPVVWLQGRRQRDPLKREIEQAMWARGWVTVWDRRDAWHLARGGASVVRCDFSHDQGRHVVVVERVRAVERSTPIGPDEDATTEVLERVRGGEHPLPERHDADQPNQGSTRGAWVIDAPALAHLVADALGA